MAENVFALAQRLDSRRPQAERPRLRFRLLSGQPALRPRQLPQPAEQPCRLTSMKQHRRLRPLVDADQYRPLLDAPRLFRCAHRQLPGDPPLPGKAGAGQRAFPAARLRIGQADCLPQLHQGLIKRARCLGRQHGRRGGCKPPLGRGAKDILPVGRQPGQHPHDIPVHRRHRDPEGDGRHRPRRVFPDPRQAEQRLVIPGHLAAVLLQNDPRRLLQVARPAVIPEALPQLEEPILPAGGQIPNGGKLTHKSVEIGQHRLDAGLLQHDFRYPYPVGRGVQPPGQQPPVRVVPVQQRPPVGGQPLPFLRRAGGRASPPHSACARARRPASVRTTAPRLMCGMSKRKSGRFAPSSVICRSCANSPLSSYSA